MKNTNEIGGIINPGKRRRKPYAVRITYGWVDGKQIYGYISYYATQKEAQKALAEYSSIYRIQNSGISKHKCTHTDVDYIAKHIKKLSLNFIINIVKPRLITQYKRGFKFKFNCILRHKNSLK